MIKQQIKMTCKLWVLFTGLLGLSMPLMAGALHSGEWIGIQGVLSEPSGLRVEDGPYAACFSLYNRPSGGQKMWQECDTLQVVLGRWQTVLGQDSTLPENMTSAWLEMVIRGETLAERMPLTGVLRSQRAALVTDSIAPGTKLGSGVAVQSINGVMDQVEIRGQGAIRVESLEDTLNLSINLDSIRGAWLDSVPKIKLQVIRNGTSSAAIPPCNSTNEGTLIYNGSAAYANLGIVQVCRFTGARGSYEWVSLHN